MRSRKKSPLGGTAQRVLFRAVRSPSKHKKGWQKGRGKGLLKFKLGHVREHMERHGNPSVPPALASVNDKAFETNEYVNKNEMKTKIKRMHLRHNIPFRH